MQGFIINYEEKNENCDKLDICMYVEEVVVADKSLI
jgi:hypothetical protein